ncbi:ribonuclease H-like domain-containing protein [Tanacetum coccineum]|uniref:Ribonuclease H-like domain-containing protein n=1 Tax=Tanacetum coccineum TaxID=301880 RepID=A0ABQ5F1M8_9ASTR
MVLFNILLSPDISYAVKQVYLYMHDPREPHLVALKLILHYVRKNIDHCLQLHVSSTNLLIAYTDVDWAGCPEEYRGVANVVAEIAWVRNLLLDLHASLSTATLVYCDNVSVVYLSTNLVHILHVPSRFQYADIFTKGLPSALFLEFHSSLNIRRPPVSITGEMEDLNITIEEYIQLEAEKACRRDQEFNWETTTYGKVRYFEDINYFNDFENEFPAIVYKDALTSKPKVSSEPTVSARHVKKVDFDFEI